MLQVLVEVNLEVLVRVTDVHFLKQPVTYVALHKEVFLLVFFSDLVLPQPSEYFGRLLTRQLEPVTKALCIKRGQVGDCVSKALLLCRVPPDTNFFLAGHQLTDFNIVRMLLQS